MFGCFSDSLSLFLLLFIVEKKIDTTSTIETGRATMREKDYVRRKEIEWQRITSGDLSMIDEDSIKTAFFVSMAIERCPLFGN
jgi:hypothetical protein